ncbi:hypothetical protein B0H34DRAFT_690343 [Crassisporium funariophilum]|nr:hypothetical protein B0H34DRAFT_690343 [Crassisporium funariophilum]
MQIKQILVALLVSGASIASAMPVYNSDARGLSISARDIDLINDIVAIAVREVLEARGGSGSKDKGKGKEKEKKKEDRPPSYGKVSPPPPGWTQGSHGVTDFHSEWDPNQTNYDNNHKSPSHTGRRS